MSTAAEMFFLLLSRSLHFLLICLEFLFGKRTKISMQWKGGEEYGQLNVNPLFELLAYKSQ